MQVVNQRQTSPLRGEIALVTGGSRGIGRAICIELARAGADVVIHYHERAASAAEVAKICRELGVRAITLQANLAEPSQVTTMMATVEDFGPISILVNNAAIAQTALFLDLSLALWQETLQTNLTSAFLCTQAVLPAMIQRQFGRVINMASVWGVTGGSCEVAYSASKGGLIAMTKALAKEVAQTGITVNAIAPGAIDTDMLAHLDAEDLQEVVRDIPMNRLGRPEEIAHTVVYLASSGASYVTGQVISPNGGWWT